MVVDWPGPSGPGYVNLHWSSPKGGGLRGKPYKEIHEFINMAQYAATKPGTYKDIYFCLSTQSVTGKLIHGHETAFRNAKTALSLKAIWIDVDVKKDKGYATILEALDAIQAFRVAAALPPVSALVFSGGGVHVYWISDKPLTVDEWRPYAEGLKAEAIRLGLKCDAGITTDAARILRVPGTFNYKQETRRPVWVADLGATYDFGASLAKLASIVPVVHTPAATAAVTAGSARTPLPFSMAAFVGKSMAGAFQRAGLNAQADNLAEGLSSRSDLPLNPDEIFKGCVHFQDAARTHGAAHSEPLWNLTLLASTWFEGGRAWAHYFSKKHKAYIDGGPGETDAKYNDKLTRVAGGTGWPSCQAFESAGANCKACPFYGKIRSPLNLAERVEPPQGVAQAPTPPPPADLFLPHGYTVDPATGWICKVVQKTLANGLTTSDIRPLFMCQLRNPRASRNPRTFMFEVSLDHGSWGDVTLLEADLHTDQAMLKSMRRQGVKPYVDNQSGINQFMTSWMAKYDEAKKRTATVSFGWLHKEGGGEMPIGFAYGGRVVMNDGTERAAGFSDAQIEQTYRPTGSPEPWREAVKIVTDQARPANEAIIAMSLAAPLMRSTGIYNVMTCAYSPESGAHKSTSIGIGAAVWGSPLMTKERPLSSQKGIVRKMGHIRNLPIYWDEISEEEKMDEIRVILSYLSEGSGPSVLHQDRSLFDKDEWQTLMMVGSNKSLCENIARNVNYTDAKLQRVFEYTVPHCPDTKNANDVSRLIASLDYNYGHMGLLYSSMLGRDPVAIDKFVKDAWDRFNAQVEHKSSARFRSAVAATTWAGAALANSLGCEFHLDELWSWLKQQYMSQTQYIANSQSIGGTQGNTLDLMAQFFKDCVRNILTVQGMPVRQEGHPEAIAYVSGPSIMRTDKIHVRCCLTERVIEISKKQLEKFLTLSKAAPGVVIEGLKQHYSATVATAIDLAAGAGVHGGRETILRLPVPPGSPFEGVLFTNAPMDQRPVGGAETGITAAVMDMPAGFSGAAAQAAKDSALVMGMTGAAP